MTAKEAKELSKQFLPIEKRLNIIFSRIRNVAKQGK